MPDFAGAVLPGTKPAVTTQVCKTDRRTEQQ